MRGILSGAVAGAVVVGAVLTVGSFVAGPVDVPTPDDPGSGVADPVAVGEPGGKPEADNIATLEVPPPTTPDPAPAPEAVEEDPVPAGDSKPRPNVDVADAGNSGTDGDAAVAAEPETDVADATSSGDAENGPAGAAIVPARSDTPETDPEPVDEAAMASPPETGPEPAGAPENAGALLAEEGEAPEVGAVVSVLTSPEGDAAPVAPDSEARVTPVPDLPLPAEPAPDQRVDLDTGIPADPLSEPEAPSEAEEDDPAPTVDRLPRIGDPPPDADAPPPAPALPAGPAIVAYGTPFELPRDTPVMSLVLFDPGTGAVDPATLEDFPLPLTIVLDPVAPNAARSMTAYRLAGHEVAALISLDGSPPPDEIEATVDAYLAALPEAMAVVDVPEAFLQATRPRAASVADILGEHGLGLITYERGLNSGLQVIAGAGVPAATVFRDFDDGHRQASAMKRLLDVGAFRAGQEGAVILTGILRPETIAALAEWVLSSRAATVTVVPASALLLGAQ